MITSTEHLHDVHHVCLHNENCQGANDHAHAHHKESSIDERVKIAQLWCSQQGVRFTKLREQVYRLILQADKPMGAYDLLNLMQQQTNASDSNKKSSKNVAPPTVYRSLDFLLEEGFIHQLTSINAFVPCCHPREKHIAGFLICTSCDKVQECSNDAVRSFVSYTNNDVGFSVEKTVIEVMGTCKTCQQTQ